MDFLSQRREKKKTGIIPDNGIIHCAAERRRFLPAGSGSGGEAPVREAFRPAEEGWRNRGILWHAHASGHVPLPGVFRQRGLLCSGTAEPEGREGLLREGKSTAGEAIRRMAEKL